jgi:gephyrin
MSTQAPLKVGILVVSTTASKDPSSDAAGVALTSIFHGGGSRQWDVIDTRIVPDDVMTIQRQIMNWVDSPEPLNLVVTTGGTGFAVADHTPEAVTALLHKQAPGLVHGMLAASLTVTPCK